MGKVEDMRRQREARHAADERAATARRGGKASAAAPPAPDVAAVTAEAAPAEDEAAAEATHGACAVCGKTRPLQQGLVGSHQKGLGKFCPGSRKPPA
jgi:hypothetical protein